MSNRAPGIGNDLYILIVYPNRVDDHHAFVKQAQVPHVLDKGFAIFFFA
jgi:hypothetical protein